MINNSLQRPGFVVFMLYGELLSAGIKGNYNSTFMTPPSLASATARGSWASLTIFFRTFFSCLLILPSIRAVNAFLGRKTKELTQNFNCKSLRFYLNFINKEKKPHLFSEELNLILLLK